MPTKKHEDIRKYIIKQNIKYYLREYFRPLISFYKVVRREKKK